MKANFTKRLGAYIIDFLIFSLVISVIMSFLPVSDKLKELNNNLNEIQNNLLDDKITSTEYINEYKNILPEYDKENIALNICNLVFILGYFVIIPVINNGQTIGKKVMNIKIEKIDGNLDIKDMIIRNFITTSLLQLMLSSAFIYIFNNNTYFIASIIISLLQLLLVIITTFMIIYRKDKCGIQDLITKTVVNEVER